MAQAEASRAVFQGLRRWKMRPATRESSPMTITFESVLAEGGLLWQLFASLLAHHVLGIPVGPVFVVLSAGALLVLAVGSRGAS